MNQPATLPLLLKELRLPTMGRLWEEIAQQASAQSWDSTRYLAHLCEHELAERQTRRLSRHMTAAQLPPGKTIETLDFDALPNVKKQQIITLGSGDDWISKKENLLIFGPSGVGKTHLAAAIGERLVLAGHKVLFIRTTELVQKLQLAKRECTLPASLDKLDRFDCLILDDFGYVKKDEAETHVLFELICERYERRSLILTCNQPFKSWDQIFTDRTMAVAAIDRLIHYSIIFEINSESYRRKTALAQLAQQELESGQMPQEEGAENN